LRCGDLSGFTPARVREILALAEKPIGVEISRLTQAVRRCAALDEDDLRAIGQIAALEAAKIYTEDRGMTLRSWIGVVVRWRLGAMMERAGDLATREVPLGSARDLEVCLVERPSSDRALRASGEDQLVADESMSDAIAREQQRAIVMRYIARLTPRQQVLLVQHLGNSEESNEELGASLGVDRTIVWRDIAAAIEAIRKRLARRDRAVVGGVACV
jgi:DNA-directed RNA polymerase specialized sigma subunit